MRRNNSTATLNPKTGSGDSYYHRAVLHFDGVWVLYFHLKGENNTDWSRVWNAPPDICVKRMDGNDIGTEACGHNSICTLGEDTKRPSCECPPRFSLVDENDKYGNCKPDFEMYPCGPDDVVKNQTLDDLYEFIELQDTDWPTADYERYYNYTTVESCKATCLQDCLCTVAVFGNNACWKKKYPLSHGRKDSQLANMVFIKVPKDSHDPSGKSTRKKENRSILIITGSALLGTSGFINFVLLAFFSGTLLSLCHKKRKSRNLGGETAIKSNLQVYKYEELLEATGEFKEELGRGAFGIVYKGVIKASVGDDDIAVAVKKLDRVMQEGEKDFKNEVNVIGQTHHKNLVKLFGFCNEGQNRLLVYEFLPNGTLASFLFKYPKPSWKERKRIAVGIARGILYLHEECSTQIIHCDIKPQNILLDEYYNARISDFGLAKLLMMNQSHTQTGIRGTKGYLAPEWFRNKPITAKVDIYSYGVLLLEIVCCKKAVDPEDNVILTDWVYDFFQQGTLINLMEGDSEAIEDMETVERYVRTAIWCIQEVPDKRPSMRRVTQMLEGVIEVGVPPNPSPYPDSVSVDAN